MNVLSDDQKALKGYLLNEYRELDEIIMEWGDYVNIYFTHEIGIEPKLVSPTTSVPATSCFGFVVSLQDIKELHITTA